MLRDHGVARSVGGFDAPPRTVEVVCGVPVVRQLLRNHLDSVALPYAAVLPTVLVDLPVGFAFRALPEVQQQGAPIVLATHNQCPEYLEDLWTCAPAILLAYVDLLHDLVCAIERAARGDRYRMTPGVATCLTPSERHLLQKIAYGWSTKEIAAMLGLHPKTVSNQVTVLCEKMHVRDRATAALRYWGHLDS